MGAEPGLGSQTVVDSRRPSESGCGCWNSHRQEAIMAVANELAPTANMRATRDVKALDLTP